MRLSPVRLITGLCLLWLAGCAANPSRPTSGGYQVSGGLKGVGGSPLPEAQVLLSKLGAEVSKPLARAPVAADGHFSLVAPGPGDYSLWFASPGYPTRNVYLQILPDARAVSLEATLEPHELVEKPEELLVVGSWSGRNPDNAEPLKAQPDGTWVLERAAEGESATYTILGLSPGYAPICFPAEAYELDEEGNYWCRVPVKEGRIRIVLDPQKLPRAAKPSPLEVVFAPPYAFLNPLNALHARTRTQSVLASKREGSGPFDFGPLPGELLGFARDPAQPTVLRQLAALDLLALPSYSLASAYPGVQGEALAAELLQLLPTREPLWGLSFQTSVSTESLVRLVQPADRRALLEDFADHNPEVLVQLYALSQLLDDAQEAKDAERTTLLVERIKPYASMHPFTNVVLYRFNMRSQKMKGKPVPDFSLTLLDSQERVSRESLMGRFYLIDFWATWCKGCVEDIPAMTAAVEKFKGRGDFTVLSVSMDGSPDKVRRFREGEHKMPWLHVVNGADYEASLPKALDVQALPTVVLVDAQGRVVAMGESLRGERLEKTLDKLLPQAAP